MFVVLSASASVFVMIVDRLIMEIWALHLHARLNSCFLLGSRGGGWGTSCPITLFWSLFYVYSPLHRVSSLLARHGVDWIWVWVGCIRMKNGKLSFLVVYAYSVAEWNLFASWDGMGLWR